MNIRDIARLAGVSVSTVSKVMNKKDASIRPETREKILSIIKEYNYSPYANVRTPVKGTTLVMGVLVNQPSLQNAKLAGILSECHHQGYGVLIYASSDSAEEQKNMHVLSSYNVDGIIWEGVDGGTQASRDVVAGLDIPFISIGYDGSEGAPFCFDYKHLGKLCTTFLTEAQHSKILCLIPDESPRSLAFGDGVRKRMLSAGAAYTDQVCHVFNEQTDLSSLLCSCTAVVCMETRIAEAVAAQADNLGLHIPQDLSVICLNCGASSGTGSGRISTVQLPFEEMGRYAAATLIARLEAREMPRETFLLEPALDHPLSIVPPKTVRRKKMVVVGAINMDVLIGLDDSVKPGEAVTARSRIKMPGGKGLNQAVGMAKLGANTYLIGRIGKDYDGSVIYDFLRENRVNLDGVIVDEHSNTGNAYVHVLKDGEASIIGYDGASNRLCGDDIEQKAELFEDAAYCLVQFVAVPDPDLVRKTVQTAHQKGVKVLLKPCKVDAIDEEILPLVDTLMPNRKEIEKLVPGDASYEEKAQYFLDRGVKRVIITLGHRGCYLRDREHSLYFPAAKVTPVDTTGAGDAFAATLACYLADGWDIVQAIRYATVAAGLSTTRQGVPNSLVDNESIALFMAQEKNASTEP